jgi:hypothetical protein
MVGDVPSGYLGGKEGSINAAGKHLIGTIIAGGKRVSDFFSPFRVVNSNTDLPRSCSSGQPSSVLAAAFASQ